MYQYMAEILKVVDGDTVDVRIDLGFSVHIMQRVRLNGVDTPECRTTDPVEKRFGFMAKSFVVFNLVVGCKYQLDTDLDDTGKFGRVLGVFTLPDGTTINDALIQKRLAVAYVGQNKELVRAAHEANWKFLDEVAEK